MTKIVVDTNIVFSALLNTNSRIGQILIKVAEGLKNIEIEIKDLTIWNKIKTQANE